MDKHCKVEFDIKNSKGTTVALDVGKIQKLEDYSKVSIYKDDSFEISKNPSDQSDKDIILKFMQKSGYSQNEEFTISFKAHD